MRTRQMCGSEVCRGLRVTQSPQAVEGVLAGIVDVMVWSGLGSIGTAPSRV